MHTDKFKFKAAADEMIMRLMPFICRANKAVSISIETEAITIVLSTENLCLKLIKYGFFKKYICDSFLLFEVLNNVFCYKHYNMSNVTSFFFFFCSDSLL